MLITKLIVFLAVASHVFASYAVPRSCFEKPAEIAGPRPEYYTNEFSDIHLLTGGLYKIGMKLDSIFYCKKPGDSKLTSIQMILVNPPETEMNEVEFASTKKTV